MKVFVVYYDERKWDGDGWDKAIDSVFSSEEEAKAYCKSRAADSTYRDRSYDYESFEMK